MTVNDDNDGDVLSMWRLFPLRVMGLEDGNKSAGESLWIHSIPNTQPPCEEAKDVETQIATETAIAIPRYATGGAGHHLPHLPPTTSPEWWGHQNEQWSC